MRSTLLALGCLIAVAGCSSASYRVGGPALISGKTPAAANSMGSEPQPPNSLPPGAEGMGTGPNARAPNYGSVTVASPYL